MTDFTFSFAKPNTPVDEKKPDTRTWVQSMFCDYDPVTGNHVPLQVRAQDASKVSKLGDVKNEPNCIPLLLNFGSAAEGYKGKLKNKNILVLGGSRNGKAGQGKLWMPLDQVNDFVERVQALTEAANTELPRLQASLGNADVEQVGGLEFETE